MAKNFPYFKFTVTEWLTGDIVYEPFNVQGLFINICALYWQRDGMIKIEDINKRFKDPVELNELTGRFISVNNGFISIAFLDEQLMAANHISTQNKQNGAKGGRPKTLVSQGKKPTANRPLTEPKAKKSKEEKEKEKEKEEEEEYTISFKSFWDLYPVKAGKAKCEPKWNKLKPEDQNLIMETLPDFIKNKPFETYNHPNPETYLNQKRWEDVLPKPNSNEKKEYKMFSPLGHHTFHLTDSELLEKTKTGYYKLQA